MSYQALYRKYRPKTFEDVYGQEHITETLKNELANNTTVHAYLFTGTRGTGKTTCAKILANAVNCTNLHNGNPCLKCDSCNSFLSGENTDIVEIDAASNNSVEDIRELRERINFAPTSSKYRVYIIDEVHMLSISAFNALLKTLEEPPAHVIFILATTEVHKLPATILSRCQRFDFRRIDSQKICERLHFIAKQEDLTLTEEAATLIASAADGGMRDALSILDLCASGSRNIDEATVESVCAMAGTDYLLELADFIKQKDTENALLMLDRLHNSSVDMLRLLSELISHYRDLMIIKTVKQGKRPIVCSSKRLELLEKQAKDYDIKDIIFTLGCLQNSTSLMQNGNRRCEMEMAVIKLCNPQISVDIEALERRISALENGVGPVTKVIPKKETVVTPQPV
ncbi:MAG: DNA polymerase III subunit gamma/tau, partial [Ruminococcaceae bacterium]|nr:DNA polymerase III subunit gamma/tau [Oscillospiraceae bacterium]